MTKEMNVDNCGKMDWFFNQWVYGTQVPAYRFEYKVAPDGMLTGKITQSGVSDDFIMIVPIYLDMGKGWAKLGIGEDRGQFDRGDYECKIAGGAEADGCGGDERRARHEY